MVNLLLIVCVLYYVDPVDCIQYEDGKSSIIPFLVLLGPHALLSIIFGLLYTFAFKPFALKQPTTNDPLYVIKSTVPKNRTPRPKRKYGVPYYWSEDINENERRLVDITDDKYSSHIKKLMYNLWKPSRVVDGKDSAGMGGFKYIKITKIERVESVAMFQQYDAWKSKVGSKEIKIGRVEQLQKPTTYVVNTTEFISKECSDSALDEDIDHSRNEHFLFHGTLAANVESICKEGLNPKCVKRNMLGDGVYFADDPVKSNQYTDDTKDKKTLTHNNKTILLMRVCLGDILITDRPRDDKSAPCRTCLQDHCQNEKHIKFASLFYVPENKFKEYVVYRKGRSYLEYIITYDRVRNDSAMKQYLV